MADGGYNLFTATYMKMTPLGMVAGNNFDFAKPVMNSLKVMPLRFLRIGAFPPYYGDEMNFVLWNSLGIPIGISAHNTDTPITVVCMGDSLTEGFGGGGTNWPDVWKGLSTYNIINKGVSGETSGQMLARFSNDVIALNPDYCIIECGTNDAHLGVPLKDCKVNIQAMVNLCLANDIRPLFVHYTQRDNQMQLALSTGLYTFDPEYIAQYLEDVWEYERSLGYPSLLLNDATDIDDNNANMIYFYNTVNDFIHPNAEGYIKWAELINDNFDNLALDTIFSLVSGYKYIYNLSKKTFTIYDENSAIIFFKQNVLTMGEMQIDFTVHKSHQFMIVVDSQDLNGWDFIPVSTKPQEYTAGEMKVADKGVHNIYLPDRVRPYNISDIDNPAWRIKHIGNLDLDMLAHKIEKDNTISVIYSYEFEKQFTGLLEVNDKLYDVMENNSFYIDGVKWIAATRTSSHSKMTLLKAGDLLLPSWSLSLYPALNIVIKIDEVFNNRAVYEPWLIYGLKFIWNFYTEDPIDPFPIDVLDLSPSWD